MRNLPILNMRPSGTFTERSIGVPDKTTGEFYTQDYNSQGFYTQDYNSQSDVINGVPKSIWEVGGFYVEEYATPMGKNPFYQHYDSQNNKKNNMNQLTSMLKRLLDKNAQKLYKVGFINGDLELTESGKRELWGIIFDTYKKELVEKAEEIIKENEQS
jgi:hypothetical protein